MTLTDLAALGSFISGVAVLVSLVFLYFQLRQVSQQFRQNETNQRMMMQQGRSARATEGLLRGTEPHLAEIFERAHDGKPLTAVETTIFVTGTSAMFLHWEDGFLQHNAGTLDPQSWASDQAGLAHELANPAARASWLMQRMRYGAAFRAFVDGIMEKTPVALPDDDAALFERLRKEQLALVQKPDA